MVGSRARLAVAALASLAGATLTLHSQRASRSDFYIASVGLPAVDTGLAREYSHAPDTPETLARKALRAGLRGEAIAGAGAASYESGRVIVRFRDDASDAARLAAVREATPAGAVGTRDSDANFDIVHINPGEDAQAVATVLAEHGDVVEYAQAAYRAHTMFVPNDPYYRPNAALLPTGQWNLPMLDLERAWDIQPNAGSTITVAVLDSGLAFHDATITATIPAFRRNGVLYPPLGRVTIPYSAARQVVAVNQPDRIVLPRDFIWNNTDPLDFDGHGTHVSGTIGQLTNDNVGTAGVAFNVRLMPVKVIDGDWDLLFGAPNEGTDDTVARGIRYAADNGAKVINMSIGRDGPPAPAVEDAIRYAVGRGVFIAISAGNAFEDGNPIEIYAEIASRVNGAISVAAVDPARNHAYYSSSGSYVEIAAPGGSQRGFSGPDGFVFQQTFHPDFTDTFLLPPSQYRAPRFDVVAYIGYIGTSMASPHVAGLAAMMMQQGITNPAAIEDALKKYATDLGTPGRDNLYGFGLINARNSLFGMGVAR
jgi:serine protease